MACDNISSTSALLIGSRAKRLGCVIRDLKHRQRNARRRPSQPKEDWVEGFVLVVLRRRRVLVLRLVALAMAFKNVRNLLLINPNDGDEFVVLYDLSASKNLDFPYDLYGQFDLEELDDSESFAEFRFEKRDIRILKEVLQIPDMITCSQRSVCDGLGTRSLCCSSGFYSHADMET